MKIKQIKITDTLTGEVKFKEVTERQHEALLDKKAKLKLPLKIELIVERDM